MKKKILCLLLGLIVFIVSCTPIKTKTKNDYTKVDYDELRAVWISYYDYDFTDDNEESAKLKIETTEALIGSTQSTLDTIKNTETYHVVEVIDDLDEGKDED